MSDEMNYRMDTVPTIDPDEVSRAIVGCDVIQIDGTSDVLCVMTLRDGAKLQYLHEHRGGPESFDPQAAKSAAEAGCRINVEDHLQRHPGSRPPRRAPEPAVAMEQARQLAEASALARAEAEAEAQAAAEAEAQAAAEAARATPPGHGLPDPDMPPAPSDEQSSDSEGKRP